MKAHEAVAAVAAEVRPVSKGDWNEQGRFHFRGVDAVVNAVSPILDRHGVIIVPRVLTYTTGTVVVGKNRTEMCSAEMTVEFRWYGPEGDWIESVTAGSAMDSGDKATSKAHSVAYRTSILQTLHLPTDEVDPDAAQYEKSQRDVADTKRLILRHAEAAGHDLEWIKGDYAQWSTGGEISTADLDSLVAYARSIEPKTTVRRQS